MQQYRHTNRVSNFFVEVYRSHQKTSDELCGDLRDDGVSVSAQSHHSGGNPCSQRECPGFNWPEIPIPA